MADSLYDKALDDTALQNRGVPEEWSSRVRSELRGLERLHWIGQPVPRHFAKQAWPAVAVGIVFLGITGVLAVLFLAESLKGHAKGALEIIPVWLLLGVFSTLGACLLGAPIWQRKKSKRTCYALTDRRAILWEVGALGGVEVRSYYPNDLTRMYRIEYPGGCGDVVFEEEGMIRRDGFAERIVKTTTHGFLGIEDVREVEDLAFRTLLEPEVWQEKR